MALAGVGTSTTNAITGALGYQGNAQAAGANATGAAISNASLPSSLALNQLLGGSNGIYTPAQIGAIGQMPASSITDAQANAYGIANGLTPNG